MDKRIGVGRSDRNGGSDGVAATADRTAMPVDAADGIEDGGWASGNTRIDRSVAATTSEVVLERYDRALDRLYASATTAERTGSDVDATVAERRRRADRLHAAAAAVERFPGEAFTRIDREGVAPRRPVTPASFVDRVELAEDDVVLLEGPTTTRTFELFRRLFEAVTDEGVIVSTKHASRDVVDAFDVADLTVVDCTASGPKTSTAAAHGEHRPVGRSNDLTGIGTGIVASLDGPAERDRALGVYTLDQMRIAQPDRVVDRFLCVLTGKLRNWGVGALVATDPRTADDGRRLAAQFDYRVSVREVGGGAGDVELKVIGKLGVAEQWRSLRLR
jgi:hypothetical protein